MTTLMQQSATVDAQHSATASSQHRVFEGSNLLNYRLFDVTEALFTLRLKVRTDRLSDPLFDRCIAIYKRPPQPPRQLTTNGGLSAAGHTDKRYAFF